jgi:integrase
MKLTTASIDLPEGKRDHIVWDGTLRGFGLRVRRLSGDRISRAWIIQYRANGHGRRMIVADAEKVTAAQARERARRLLATVELGGDPQGDKKERRDADAQTLRSIIGDYLDAKTDLRPNSLRALRKYLGSSAYLAGLYTMPADRITRKDVAGRLLAVQKENGTSPAFGFRAHLNALFSWAVEAGLLESNPVIGSFRPSDTPSRDRVLSNAELVAIWRSVEGMSDYATVIRLLMLTATRREEVARMAWSEFGDDGSTWTLPAERSKNGRAHTLPITSLMQGVIDDIPRRFGSVYLFRKRGFTGWITGKRALDARLDLPAWRVHDVRRSVASGMGDLGIAPHVIEQILNHSRRGVAGIYNKSPYEREVRAAMVLWSDHVASLITGGERKVVAFVAAAATL